jgi:DNA-binding winged helix-turn-helix (wHTH) protein
MGASTVRFDQFELDPATGELTRNGVTVRLEPQPAAVLACLASRAGRLVTRAELERVLWDEHTHVDVQDGLNFAVRRVRLALGDSPRSPRFIETIPKRGYRFLKPVVQSSAVDSLVAADSGAEAGKNGSRGPDRPGDVEPAPGRRFPQPWIRLGLLGLAAATALGVAVLEQQRPNRHHEITVNALKAVHDVIFPPSANSR